MFDLEFIPSYCMILRSDIKSLKRLPADPRVSPEPISRYDAKEPDIVGRSAILIRIYGNNASSSIVSLS